MKAIEKAEQELTREKELTPEERKEEAKRRKKLRNEITHKLRFDVLQRDHHTCQYCGVRLNGKMANGEDVELVVDHIVPLEKGGTNDLTNLITACWVCNEGKKARMLTHSLVKKEYKLNKDKIIAVAETSNFEKFKEFMLDETNQEERQWCWDEYEARKEYRCIKDCEKCIAADNFYFKSCIQHLYHYAKFNVDDNIILPREESGIVKIFDSGINKLQCDWCYVSRRCPKYQIGSNCAFDFNPVDNFEPKKLMERMVGIQAERVVTASFFEKIDGGAIDKNLSAEMGLLGQLIKLKGDIDKPRVKVDISAEGEGKEGTDAVAVMLKNMFGGGGNNQESKEVKNPKDDAQDAEIVEDN